MKKMLKKIFSILLAACFVLSVVPAPAAAAETTTNGQYSNGAWSEGGTGSITYDNGITLSKTAKALGNNQFEITLQVQTSQTTSTVTGGGAVVLVMDVSGSMAYCAECGEDSHESDCTHFKSGWFADNSVKYSQSRMAAAQTAAKNFLKEYAGTDASASRMLAIVTFATNYSPELNWVNVAGGAGKNSYDAAVSAIDDMSANGGTNLEGGLYTASGLLDSIAGDKSVVLLTDGAPTYYIGGGQGSSGSETCNSRAAAQATAIKNKGADLYTVCFGVANETTYRNGPTVGNFLSGQVASSGCAYNADNSAELYAAFAAITESITEGLDGAGLPVTDPMADMITVVDAGDNFIAGADNTYTWNLSNAEVSTNGSTTTYTYTYTYTVELNVQGQNFEEGKFFPTNKETYLTLADGSKLAFPVPGVTGTLPRTSVTVTKTWDDANNQDGIRPESVTVQLTKDGKAVEGYEAVELNEANGWSYTWTGLIKQSKGAYHNYSVVELDLTEDYTYTATNTANGEETITLTNTHVPAVVSKTVTKVWNDADNQDGKRPDSISVVLKADGAEKATVELNAANNWSYTWENLPEKAAGKVINYTVDEVEVPAGYDKTVNGLTITNSYTPETTKVEGTKTWDDDNNRDNVRPESITINLLADGEQVASQEVTGEGNTWTFAFENLPKYRDGGVEIVYTITEDVPGDYEATYDGYNVTNTHEIYTREVPVTKIWNDKNDEAGFRPDQVTISLYANGKDTGLTVVLSGTEMVWTGSFVGVPLNENGEEITYTLVELDVPEKYTSVVDGFAITNSYTPEQTSVTITKIWDDAQDQDGKRPDAVQFVLKANGEAVQTVSFGGEGDTWTTVVDGLAKYADGEEIVYTAEEVAVDEYQTSYSEDKLTITNKHTPATTDITVTKEWDDEDDLAGFRPESVTVILLADGEEVGTIDLSEENKWTHTFENLPENAAGEKIEYTVKETKVPEHYTATVTGSVEEGFVITNTHVVERTDLNVVKVWDDDSNRDGIRPETVIVKLLVNGEPANIPSISLGEHNDWTTIFGGMPVYANGEKIEYSIAEVNVPEGYTSSTEFDEETNTFTITNTHNPEVTDIVITKEWVDADDQDGLRPDKIEVTLYANGTEWKTVELKKNNDWTYTFEDLFVNSNGKAIEYTVEETPVEGYETSIEGFAITNTHEVKKTEISVEKVWDDMQDQDGIRPASITIKLLAGKEVVKEAVLNEENKWSYTFTDLDVNAAGKEIKYSVEEVKVDGYESKVTGSAEEGFIVTNTHTPETIDEIKVTKVWDDADNQDGIRPEKVTVNLLANGKVIETVELKATIRSFFTGDWTATFKDLPKFENGKEIVYTVTENAVPGYETKIEGFTITNTHEPETTELNVQKFWKDENNKDKTRPESVKITLYANGKSTGKTVTLNEKNQWFDSFENLPKFDNGKEIKYTVKEASLAMYKASYSYNGTKAVVTNTLSESPNTGDTSNVGLYLALMGICAVAAVALIIVGKKRKA